MAAFQRYVVHSTWSEHHTHCGDDAMQSPQVVLVSQEVCLSPQTVAEHG